MRVRQGTGWKGRESGRERVGKGANPAGNSPEGISAAWGKSLGSTCAPAVEDGLEHPHLGQRKLPREPVVQLFSRQLRTPAVLQLGGLQSNSATIRRFIPLVHSSTAPQFDDAAFRWFRTQWLCASAVLHPEGSRPDSFALRQFCNTAVQNPTISQLGSAAFRWLRTQWLRASAVQKQSCNSAMPHSGVCNPIVRAPAAAAANIPLMPGRQPKRRGAQQGPSQKKSKSYSI